MPERKHDEIIASRFAKKFFARFAAAPHHIFRAPGRVNLIGEHTDYNDGFVLPAAIALCTWTAIAPRKDHELHVFSENLNETAELDLTETHPQPQHRWSDYIHGVALMLQRLAVPLAGGNIFIASDIPSGAGLSSSAALEVSVASALLSNSGRTLDLVEIAKLCQRAPLPASLAMVVCNTMVKHGHAGGEYNKRRAQCEEGVALLRRYFPSIKALRGVTLAQLQAHRDELPELIYRRCHHAISENERVLRCATALQAGDLATVGHCMAESHLSLKNDYQVSCGELDVMVEIAARLDGVVGSRMTGGGFGGSTINLVRTAAIEEFRHSVAKEYTLATQIAPDIYVSKAGQGITEVDASV